MLIIKNLKFGYRKYNEEISLVRGILESMNPQGEIILNVYKNYPDKIRGKLIKSEKLERGILRDIKIKDYIDFSKYSLSEIIFEFEFNINIDNENISCYIRLNNEHLRKIYGDIEMDIYPFKDIANLGDLIYKKDLVDLKNSIESAVKKYKELKIPLKEAYICVSFGEPSIDLSKRVWIYYSNPIFLVSDLISFIKYFKELEFGEGQDVPKYLIPYYEEIIHKLRPYSIDFLSREFMGSEKFVKRFENAVSEKQIIVKKGSLILSSNNIENNFLLARDLSEKLIFPVMKQVIGDKEFKDILDKSL